MSRKEQKMESTQFVDCAIYKDKLLFITVKESALVELDYNNGSYNFKNNTLLEGSTNRVLCVDDEFYALELDGRRLALIDLTTGIQEYYSINCGKKEWNNYILITELSGKIYIFPQSESEVVVFDRQTKSIEKKMITSMCFVPDDKMRCSCRLGNNVYIIDNNGKTLMCYELETERAYEILQLKDVQAKWYVFGLQNNLFFVSWDNQLVKIDVQTGRIESLWQFPKTEDILRVVVTAKNIWILPKLGNRIYIYDIMKKSAAEFDEYPDDFCYKEVMWGKYGEYTENEHEYYLSPRLGNYILVIQKETGNYRWIKPNVTNREDQLIILKKKYGNVFYENAVCFDEFIQILHVTNIFDQKETKRTGYDIYSHMVK